MRNTFLNTLIEEARTRPEIFLVVGDLGYSVVEPFQREFPDRFLNAGIAEQNMTGVAAGLASEGYHVFTYSIANFPTLRCLEQIRNDVCYHRLPVTVVAVGAGLAYGKLGYSHHAVQDLAVMAALPELTSYTPCDPVETRLCTRHLARRPGPSYLRLGQTGEARLHLTEPGDPDELLSLQLGAGDTAIVGAGSCLALARDALNQPELAGLGVSLWSCPSHKLGALAQFAPLARYRRVLVIEEQIVPVIHSALVLGLGGKVRVDSLHLKPELLGVVGSQASLRELHGIGTQAIAAALLAP